MITRRPLIAAGYPHCKGSSHEAPTKVPHLRGNRLAR
jgi:hypothetical protein